MFFILYFFQKMKKRWFTLIEMLIVIVIIGVLAWALIPRIGSARDKANDTAREANARSIATAMVSYGLDNWSYPAESGNQVSGNNLLQEYSIPDGNFKGQPTESDTYHYRRLDSWSHFVVRIDLSEWTNAWNCSGTAVSTLTWYNAVNARIWNTGESFCYLQ